MHKSKYHRHWSRRTSSVPKGYLRTQVLQLLSDKAMSGAEIMRAIEEDTGMRWRPSPGSVYPLLSWLLDSGYTRELPDSEAGVRRYELTEEGKKFFEEHEQRREQDRGARFFGPQFDDWDGPMPEEARKLVDSWRNMRRAGRAFRRRIRDDYSDSLVREAQKLVDDFAKELYRLAEAKET